VHRLSSSLILKFIALRFRKIGNVFDDIEVIDDVVASIVRNVINILTQLKTKMHFQPEMRFDYQIEHLLKELNSEFALGKTEDLESVLYYIKSREMKDYLGRKRKSKFIRPRRNDEKLKKVYKNLMKVLKEDYENKNSKCPDNVDNVRSEFFTKSFAANQVSQTNQYSNNYFLSDPYFNKENNLSMINKNNSASYLQNNSEKKLPNFNKNEFYKSFFDEICSERKIPLNYFFDPLRKESGNTKFKSFTTTYLKLLLESQKFKQSVCGLIKEGTLVCRTVGEYPYELNFILRSSPNVLMAQYKKKAKFLWTVYEFYFAMELFMQKVLN
jgi:hypothetical protein